MTRSHGPDLPHAPPLVDVAWLAAQHRDVVCFEVDVDSSSFHAGHLPGARPLDWYDDLHEHVRRGPVSLEHFEHLMQRNGVREDTHVVLSGARATGHAAHAYWLLRYYQHSRVSLLDGGRPAWLRAGLRLEDDEPARPAPAPYRSPGLDHSIRIRRDELLADHVGAPAPALVLDCRTPHEFAGHTGHAVDVAVERHRVQGHIPGAVNLPSALLLTDDGRFRPQSELRTLLTAHGLTAEADVVVHGRVADQSSLLWFVVHELLGHRRARHYDAGWAEYGSLVEVPVVRVEEP